MGTRSKLFEMDENKTLTTPAWVRWLRHFAHGPAGCPACQNAMKPSNYTAVDASTEIRPRFMCKEGWRLRKAAVREKARMAQPYPGWIDGDTPAAPEPPTCAATPEGVECSGGA